VKVQINTRFPDEWAGAIDEYCEANEMTRPDVVKAAVKKFLNIGGDEEGTDPDETVTLFLEARADEVAFLRAELREKNDQIHRMQASLQTLAMSNNKPGLIDRAARYLGLSKKTDDNP
jgi:hypothetical protein